MVTAGRPSNIVIVKKRIKGGGDAHHGGAWKVAYADFVTAMMAFFLLMWLLNATTEEQRKGLADYFNPTIPMSSVSGGGQAALNGSSILSEDDLIRNGAGATDAYPEATYEEYDAREATQTAGQGQLEDVRNQIEESNASDAEGLGKHIQTRMTPDGLLIELIDTDEDPLFALGSARPSDILGELLYAIAPVLATIENDAKIAGHTDALSFAHPGGYSNWELSTDRAHAARRLLVNSGFPASQIAEVSGSASRNPITLDPTAPQNRRVTITLLSR